MQYYLVWFWVLGDIPLPTPRDKVLFGIPKNIAVSGYQPTLIKIAQPWVLVKKKKKKKKIVEP